MVLSPVVSVTFGHRIDNFEIKWSKPTRNLPPLRDLLERELDGRNSLRPGGILEDAVAIHSEKL
jgi:hypothetical protein